MAIIILKGADFSDNNIGKISLPEEMNAFTKRIFSACTKYSIFSPQASIVNDFVNYLDNEGLLSHIGFFMAPWLSSDVNEATYNVAKDTQLQYSAGVTFANGVLETDSNTAGGVTIGDNVIPFVNFVGCIPSDLPKAWTHVITCGESTNFATLFSNYNQSNNVIAKSINPNAGYGYQLYNSQSVMLYNIKGLSDLDTNGTTLSGRSVKASEGYNKETSEPLKAPNGLTRLLVNCPQATTKVKQIFIAGDGTNLTDAQVTSMIAAMKVLQDGLNALEE